MEDMLADLTTKGLARDRQERLLGLMGVGLCGETTTPSPVEDTSELGRIGMESPSGSVEFTAPPCKDRYELCKIDYLTWDYPIYAR